MKLKKLTPHKSKAQAMVEFAIALPVLLALVYGILEAGRLLFLYSTVVTASRQAVRYGSATGVGNGTGNPNEHRYWDCDGIRTAAQNAGYLGAFDTVTIKWDSGPSTPQTTYCTDPSTDSSFVPNPNNSSRVSVTVTEHFTPLVPSLVPFIARDISATSARTVIVGVTIAVTEVVQGSSPTTTTITADTPDPSDIGQNVNVTVTVTGGSTSPTGTVTITGADVNCTITLSGGTGSCNVIFNSGGTKLLNASYGGDSTHLTSTDPDGEAHKVRYSTTTTINSHLPEPASTGQQVTITVTVTSNGGPVIPNGAVVNITGDVTCTITLTGGTGTCNVTFTAPTGEKSITATYPGDANHTGSSSTTTHDFVVNKDTITKITSHTPDPSNVNQVVTISVKVVGLTTTPTGTVTVSATGTAGCTITLSGGTGSCTVTFTTVGAKTISAAYGGSANHNASTSASKGHTVGLQATTTTIVSDTPDPSAVGGTVTVTVSVTGGAPTPTGTVAISGADVNCTITLPATSCTVVFNTSGTKTISASYSGDGTHAASNTTATHSVATATTVPSCTGITHGPITKSGNTMTMTITNPWAFPLTTGAGSVSWNGDKGHQTGSDKSLNLESIAIAGTNVWPGPTSSNVSTMPFSNPAIIPAGPITVTIVLTFHQSYDNFDATESILINLSTPGCESNPIQAP